MSDSEEACPPSSRRGSGGRRYTTGFSIYVRTLLLTFLKVTFSAYPAYGIDPSLSFRMTRGDNS